MAYLGSPNNFDAMLKKLAGTEWIAYAKRPFAGPQQVLEYLGRYTHRVAISNNRITAIDHGTITFSYRDRQNNNAKKSMTLESSEFIRRFLLHVLPKGFMKIRYYGFLANVRKKEIIAVIRNLMHCLAKFPEKIKETVQQIMLRVTGMDITCCP